MDDQQDIEKIPIHKYGAYESRITLMRLVRHDDIAGVEGLIASSEVGPFEIYAALRYAIKRELLDMVMLLLGNIENPEDFHHYPIPLLHLPIYYNNVEILEYLLNQGLNINIRDDNGYTALMLAAKYGQTELVEKLLTYGADVNLTRDEDMTALALAVSNQHFEIAEMIGRME
ncbi:hypothetical protein Aperf_G00000103305 [Anoplocephala perfoliata]